MLEPWMIQTAILSVVSLLGFFLLAGNFKAELAKINQTLTRNIEEQENEPFPEDPEVILRQEVQAALQSNDPREIRHIWDTYQEKRRILRSLAKSELMSGNQRAIRGPNGEQPNIEIASAYEYAKSKWAGMNAAMKLAANHAVKSFLGKSVDEILESAESFQGAIQLAGPLMAKIPQAMNNRPRTDPEAPYDPRTGPTG